ncbi:WbqC family protein [Streptomyces sp. 4R-3d]|uniref:WbqC family protein n=1 Tax=Streptomyces sp. 4R-3d TaxID=2559605 RepID=UPI0032AF3F2D
MCVPPTSLSSPTASTAVSSSLELPPPGGLCTIQQPNLFPRLTTLAKLFAADYWIVLDDVQFTRRDYQHRTRLAALGDPLQRQWLPSRSCAAACWRPGRGAHSGSLTWPRSPGQGRSCAGPAA